MEGFQIRRATLEDKQAVLDINDNVYDGLDYLKDLYEDTFMNSCNTKAYVGVLNDKIVGFAAGTVVDDGHTVISRAARVNIQYNNKGFYKLLKNHISVDSGAVIDAFTTVETNPALNSCSFQQQNSLISTLTFLKFGISPKDDRLQTSSMESPTKLNELTQALLKEYFEIDEYRKYLFPKERIVVGWVPYRTLSSNIPLLWTRSKQCHRITDLRDQDGVMCGLMTILTTFKGVNDTLVAIFDVYGNDIESLRYHILSHFEFLRKRNDTEIVICFNSELELGYENIENVFREFGLSKITTIPFKTLCLYERSLI